MHWPFRANRCTGLFDMPPPNGFADSHCLPGNVETLCLLVALLLILSLPVFIILEACLSRRWLRISWLRACIWTSVANLASTIIVGIPFVWFSLFWGGVVIGNRNESHLSWMIPIACMVPLVPAFLVTVFVEGRIYRKAFGKNLVASYITETTWEMHLVTYGLLAVVCLSFLGWSVAEYNRCSNKHGRTGRPITVEQSKLVDPNAP